MTLVSGIRAGRHAQKLKSADSHSPEELTKLKEDLAGMGRSAVEPVADCLAHEAAREHAMAVLHRLVNNYTLPSFLGLLGSPNPEIVSGIREVLSETKAFDPTLLISMLADKDAPRGRLEPILEAHVERLALNTMVKSIPDLPRDSQAVLFRVLEKKNGKAAVPDLLRLLKNDEWWIRMHTARLLAWIPDETAVHALSALLQDPNKGVRYEAVRALEQTRQKSAVPELVESLKDPDLKVQSAAIDALIAIDDVGCVEHLLVLLGNESEYIRRAAVEVLNEVITTEAIQDLVRAMRDEDWWVRVRATDALGALGGEKVVAAVIGLFDDEDFFMRRQAVELLNSIPSDSGLKVLIRALDDEDWWVRERAIDALGKTGNPDAVPPLIELMNRDGKLAVLCVRALGELGDPRAEEPLNLLLVAESEELRREASQAIRIITQVKHTGRAPGKPSKAEERKAIPDAASTVRERTKAGPSLPFKVHADPPSPRQSRPPSIEQPVSPPPPSEPEPEHESDQRPGSPLPALNYNELAPDTTLVDRYRVIRPIGKGGFGAVYLVEDSAIGEEVVIKILNPHLSFDDSALKRFIRELKLSRKITHSNVIRIHEFVNLTGAYAVSMEYFPSKDLAELIAESGALDASRVLGIASQICTGLEAAHRVNVIHRDMKPANVLVGKNDSVKIVDFGLAAAQQQVESRLTKSGYLVGTPEYMAPEQISGEKTDHRVDIYALGIVMFEMFTGVKPFTDETAVKVFFKHLEGVTVPMRNLVPELPTGVEKLVAKAMAKEAKDRPVDVTELKDLIDREREALGGS
jgi:serine/threonine-protein kinase